VCITSRRSKPRKIMSGGSSLREVGGAEASERTRAPIVGERQDRTAVSIAWPEW